MQRMPGSAIVHAAVFTAGALLGGGIAVAVTSKKNQQHPVLPTRAAPVPTTSGLQQEQQVSVQPRFVGTDVIPASALRYGNPGPIADFIQRQAYVAAYDRRLRHPAWTAEHLTLASLGKSRVTPPEENSGGDRSNSAFKEDDSLPVVFRSKLSDYFRSGYDRGHMVPAADAKMSQEAMNETFYMSNIAPQVGDGFNRHYWAYLEDWCRRLTGTFQDVYVFTVPLYLPKKDVDGKWRVTHEVIGNPPNVSVPTHFAKVVLASKPSSPLTPDQLEVSTGAFVLPNSVIADDAPLTSFVVPVDAVERAAGLTLFSDQIKLGSKHICQTTKCEVIVRRFDDARKNVKRITGPKS
ncbi:hypothetical protein Agabi119p4_3241 [Agaricus bisporus var. burnettii]|uniref:Endonuclease n=1 Tax=Agaricus bisporus var. burnettii TaxID=192524 RepID=A0A8H7KJ69_AGABI|nr:hypothetical protein Agabi119p4_3241 [Agaricus bisporus var. burnettii]